MNNIQSALEILKSNSITPLTEGITSTDISTTDEIVSRVISQKGLDSLAYQICDVQPLHGPTGAVFALNYDSTTSKSTLDRANVTVSEDTPVNTNFTQEALQDLLSQFGKGGLGFISSIFSGISSNDENTKLLANMTTWAKNELTLTLTAPGNAETTSFEVTQKVSELVLDMNSKTFRTLDSFVVLPQKAAASFMALGSYFTDDAIEAGLFLGKKGKTKFYVNPDPLSTEAFVGLHSEHKLGCSSIIMSPYQHTIQQAVNQDTGNIYMYNFNRYAMTLSPLNKVNNEILRKFTIA